MFVRNILDRYKTPSSCHRVDGQVNEFYDPESESGVIEGLATQVAEAVKRMAETGLPLGYAGGLTVTEKVGNGEQGTSAIITAHGDKETEVAQGPASMRPDEVNQATTTGSTSTLQPGGGETTPANSSTISNSDTQAGIHTHTGQLNACSSTPAHTSNSASAPEYTSASASASALPELLPGSSCESAGSCKIPRALRNYSITEELRIDPFRIHASALYWLEDYRRRDLGEPPLEVSMVEYLETKSLVPRRKAGVVPDAATRSGLGGPGMDSREIRQKTVEDWKKKPRGYQNMKKRLVWPEAEAATAAALAGTDGEQVDGVQGIQVIEADKPDKEDEIFNPGEETDKDFDYDPGRQSQRKRRTRAHSGDEDEDDEENQGANLSGSRKRSKTKIQDGYYDGIGVHMGSYTLEVLVRHWDAHSRTAGSKRHGGPIKKTEEKKGPGRPRKLGSKTTEPRRPVGRLRKEIIESTEPQRLPRRPRKDASVRMLETSTSTRRNGLPRKSARRDGAAKVQSKTVSRTCIGVVKEELIELDEDEVDEFDSELDEEEKEEDDIDLVSEDGEHEHGTISTRSHQKKLTKKERRTPKKKVHAVPVSDSMSKTQQRSKRSYDKEVPIASGSISTTTLTTKQYTNWGKGKMTVEDGGDSDAHDDNEMESDIDIAIDYEAIGAEWDFLADL